jgi:transcriptional regulator with XRE-family HTH domain
MTLREWMQAEGLNANRLAKLAGCSPSYIYRFLKNRFPIGRGAAQKISALTKGMVSVESLMIEDNTEDLVKPYVFSDDYLNAIKKRVAAIPKCKLDRIREVARIHEEGKERVLRSMIEDTTSTYNSLILGFVNETLEASERKAK